LQRLQPPAGAADPVGKGRAVDLDAVPGKDLALPVEGQMIAVFGDQDMSEQGRGCEALGDRPLRGRCLVDGPAGPAAIARPTDTDDPEACRHMVEHLAHRLADHMQRAAAAGAGLMLDIEPPVIARQVCWQARPLGQFWMAMRLGVGDAFIEQPGVQLVIVLEPQPRREEAFTDQPDLVLDLSAPRTVCVVIFA
jgi:hypothetical protein